MNARLKNYALLICEGACEEKTEHACRGWTRAGDGRWQCQDCGAHRTGPDPRSADLERGERA